MIKHAEKIYVGLQGQSTTLKVVLDVTSGIIADGDGQAKLMDM